VLSQNMEDSSSFESCCECIIDPLFFLITIITMTLSFTPSGYEPKKYLIREGVLHLLYPNNSK
jgi:hypothetical protein